MAKRVQRQLKKQLEEQKSLEEELEKLQAAKDAKESCAEVIKFVQSTSMDPMPDIDNNPFLANCFIAGTEILVNGSQNGELKHKKIEDIKVGDEIVCVVPTHKDFRESIDSINQESAFVTAIHQSFTSHICCIKYRNTNTNEERTIECTESHPIYVNKVGWKTVSGKANGNEHYDFDIFKLNIGDEVCLETGDMAHILHIHFTHLLQPLAVYNLTASHGHTFFANALLVHNKGCCESCIIL